MNMAAYIDPPQPIANVETEAGLITAILIDNKAIDRIADLVESRDFFDPFYRNVFELIVHERSLGNAVHPGTLRRSIGDEGAKMLASLTGSSGATLIGADDFAREIREFGRLRRMVDGFDNLSAAARQTGTGEAALTAEELIADAETVLAEAADHKEASATATAADCVRALVDNLGKDQPGVRSGIGSLDATLGDIRAEDMVILGARPGMGKSAVASSYALGAAARGHGVLFVSLEMSSEALAERMASDLCFDSDVQVPYSAITERRVSTPQARQIARAAELISDLPLTIARYGSMTTGRLNALVRRHKRRLAARHQKLELVIVDYLQLMRPDAREKDLYTRITEVSKGLKDMAVANGVGVMALCQLSREVEKRADKRPQMSDLRDSGQIEQDADAICFLFAPEYYLMQAEPSGERDAMLKDAAGKIEFIVPKRRRGPGGVGHGHFYRQFQAVRG